MAARLVVEPVETFFGLSVGRFDPGWFAKSILLASSVFQFVMAFVLQRFWSVLFFLLVAKVRVRCKIYSRMRCCRFVAIESGVLGRLPNNACSRQVGVAAFSGIFLASGFSLLPGRIHARPLAGNASR